MINGVTFTLNNDGTYLVNGKATADAHFSVDTVNLKEGTYAIFNNGHEFWTYMNYYNETTKTWVNVSEANTSMKNSYKKVIITKTDASAKKSGNSFKFAFWIPKGMVCENLIFKPMLTTSLTAPAKTYVPSTQTKGITNTMASVSIKRGTKQVIDNTSLKDGRLYFTTDQTINKIYTDIPDGQGSLERITIGGGTEVDSALSTTSTNPVQNKVITSSINTINTNLSNITSDVSTLQTGLQTANNNITKAFEVSAPIEKSPSTHNYAVGDYLIWNEALRKVTSAISVGDSLTNSNTTLTNSGKELSQINADLSDIFKGYNLYEDSAQLSNLSGGEKTLNFSSLPNGLTEGYILSAHLGGYMLPYVGTSTSFMAIDTLNASTKNATLRFSNDWASTTGTLKVLILAK